MEADEHHAQRVVGECSVVLLDGNRRSEPAFVRLSDAVFLFLPALLATHRVERQVLRRLHQPGGGVLRHPAIRPRLQRAHQRLLHHILGQLQPMNPEMVREHPHDARAFVTEQILRDARGLVWIRRERHSSPS